MGKKLTPNQAEFERQTKRIRDMMKGMEGMGYKFSRSPIDDLPQRVSAKKISELQSVTTDTLKRYADKPDNKSPKVGSQAAEEAPHRRTSHLSEDDTSTGVGRRGGNHNGNHANLQHNGNSENLQHKGNPENLQHKGNPENLQHKGNPANLQHKGNPANLQHKGNPANLQHKGNPANLQHKGNPANLQHKGNPANLQHKGNPANLKPHPENLKHKGNPENLKRKGNPANLQPHPENLKPHPENLKPGGKKGSKRSSRKSPKDTDLYGIIYSSFWDIIEYDFKSVYGQTGRDIVADWANYMIEKYGEEMFVIGLNIAAADGHVLSTEMMYDDALRLDFFMEVVKAINDQLGETTSFEDSHSMRVLNDRESMSIYGTVNYKLNEIAADSRYQQGEEENYYNEWD